MMSVFQFNQKGIQNIVHALKYQNIRDVAPWMGRCMAASWQLHGAEIPECLIPIPLHRSRLKEREYNQATLLAQTIQGVLGVPVREDILIRSRKTATQTQLSSDDRRKNIEGCFSLVDGS